MATTSTITALTSLSSVQSDDILPIVDVHDTTQAPSGSTKKITVAALLAAYLTSAGAASTYLPLTGGTLTGGLTISSGTTSLLTTNVTGTLTVSANSLYQANLTVNGALSAGGVTSLQATTIAGALTHSGSTAGFFGTTPVSRATITGTRAGHDSIALTLLSEMARLGLVVDGTT